MIVAVVLILSFATNVVASDKPGWAQNLDLKTELIRWSVTGLMAGATAFVYRQDVWVDAPLIGGSVDKAYRRRELVSGAWLGAGLATGIAAVSLVPTSDGWITEGNYRHGLGLVQAVVATGFVSTVLKQAIGRKRPDYDARAAQGRDLAYGRRSFPSMHASLSWTTSSYLVLNIWNRWLPKSRDATDTALAISGSALVSAAAAYVSWSRLHDNRHHLSDVVSGAAIGTISGGLFYYWSEALFLSDNTDRVAAAFSPGKAVLTLRF
jgi:membrane-associated phospholipid phosphatase